MYYKNEWHKEAHKTAAARYGNRGSIADTVLYLASAVAGPDHLDEVITVQGGALGFTIPKTGWMTGGDISLLQLARQICDGSVSLDLLAKLDRTYYEVAIQALRIRTGHLVG